MCSLLLTGYVFCGGYAHEDAWKIIPCGCGKERYVEDHPVRLREGKIRGRSSRVVAGRKDTWKIIPRGYGKERCGGRERKRMKPGRKRTGKKRTLTGQISRIVLILILVGVLEAGAAYTMLEWYHDQVAELEYTISDIYLSEVDQNFNLINISIQNMLYSSDEISQVLEMQQILPEYAGETEKLAYMLGKNRSVLQLKEMFADMVLYYGSRFNFFYMDPEKQLLVENGGSEYMRRMLFCDLLDEKFLDGEIRYTSNGKWFLMGDYLCTIYKGPDGIGGAYIWAGDFAASILRMSPTECASINIYDLTKQSSLVYERLENGLLSEGRQIPDAELPEDFYRLDHAELVCSFAMDTSAYENAVILPVLFLGLLGIYLVVMAIVLLYTKRKVLGQVNAFYNNLIEYKTTERFDEETGIEEFAEAGKVLNQRSEEISQLKISIYEEQIIRQSVELDYAQLQIRPHFYINCLNIIHSMAQERLTREIQEFVVHISHYFRYIFKKGMEPVTVGKELEFTETYLKILECMNDTEYRYEVSCARDASDAEIPPLIIQTFVENAVKHNLDEVENCVIRVQVEQLRGAVPGAGAREDTVGDGASGAGRDEQARACARGADGADSRTADAGTGVCAAEDVKRNGGSRMTGSAALPEETHGEAGSGREWLKILIWDNGRGFDETSLERLRSGDFGTDGTGFHIGIRNAVARMRMIYGEDAFVRFSNPADGGARVDIFIPQKEETV